MHFKILFFVPLILFAKDRFCEPWGQDADLRAPSTSIQSIKSPSLAVRVAHGIIRFHQEVLSPIDGPRSHFRPSSSQYMYLALQRHGFLKGFFMGCDRLLRENDEEWVYRTIEWEGKSFKFDPIKE